MKTNELNFLVVDDDDFQRMMIVNMLNILGAKSICDSANGKDALEVLRTEKGIFVDIVLCDLNMPEMDGMEFLRHLGQLKHKASVILISALGEKILKSVAKSTSLHDVKLLGVLDKPINTEILEDLLLNFVQIESNYDQAITSKIFTIEKMLHGIDENQFEPFFQPKVNFKTGKIVGAEALARWIHPELGAINPYEFIPLLEKSGQIDRLTFLILEKSSLACQQLIEKGFSLTISVNLSSNSLENSRLDLMVSHVVKKVGLDPSSIILEIKESVAMTDVAQSLKNLTRLSVNGFALSIDDYGTGLSSVQQLTRNDFSELKIDKSFVKDFSKNEALRLKVKSSIDMAHKLNIKSVAEGVETQLEWDILKEMGCDIAQGYFIARPMNLEAFLKFCEEYPVKHPAII